MFLSQDGVVLCTTLRAMDQLGILGPSLAADRSPAELYPELTDPGFGALRVGVQCLASTGWLAIPPTLDPETTTLSWTEAGRRRARHHDSYVAVGGFLAASTPAPKTPGRGRGTPSATTPSASSWAGRGERWGLERACPPSWRRSSGPTSTGRWRCRRCSRCTRRAGCTTTGPTCRPRRPATCWQHSAGSTATGAWTDDGRQARAFALNFGGVATYLPLLARLPELYRGELSAALRDGDGDREWHVHRELNLSVSARRPQPLLRAMPTRSSLEIFDREPVSEQPLFIADMGCGDGSWLARLHQLVGERTLRGRHLDAHPLAHRRDRREPDRAASRRRCDSRRPGSRRSADPRRRHRPRRARRRPRRARPGDRGRPARAGVPRPRPHATSAPPPRASSPRLSSGAYIDDSGRALAGEEVERDLCAHLARWAPHVRKHGLIVLEAHCVAPGIAARHLGRSTASPSTPTTRTRTSTRSNTRPSSPAVGPPGSRP